MKWEGITVNWEKFDELKKQWIEKKEGGFFCPKHQTYFVPELDEPCWDCYDSCLLKGGE